MISGSVHTMQDCKSNLDEDPSLNIATRTDFFKGEVHPEIKLVLIGVEK